MAFVIGNDVMLKLYNIYDTPEYGNNYAFCRKVMADFGIDENTASIIWQSIDIAIEHALFYVKANIPEEKVVLKRVTKFKCKVCGHLSAGKKPQGGDGSVRFPRKHYRKEDDELCDGCFEEAEWVTVEEYL